MPRRAPRSIGPYTAPVLITLILLGADVSFGILHHYRLTALAILTAVACEVALHRGLGARWPTQLASAYITGISVGILLRPLAWWPYVACSALSITSKHALRLDGRHLWNPSNFGVSAMLFLAPTATATLSIQWGNAVWPMLVIWALGTIILLRLGRLHICLCYVLSYLLLAALRAKVSGTPLLGAVSPLTGPMYQLFIMFMITDPKTTVGSRRGQCLVAVLVAVVEALLRLAEVVHAPYYALFLVGPSANLVEILAARRRAARAQRGTRPPPEGTRAAALGLALALSAVAAGCSGGGGGGAPDATSTGLPALDLGQGSQAGVRTLFGRGSGGGDIGLPVEAGDLDGDGSVDIAIGQIIAAAGAAGDRVRAGRVTVVFGDGVIAGEKDLATDLADTLVIEGADERDYLGTELGFGDVSGDGTPDLIIGAQFADGPPGAGARPECGEVWVVLGGAGTRTAGAIDLAAPPGSGLVRIIGAAAGDRLGIYVDAADVTGDGRADLLLGADLVDGTPAAPRQDAGAVYVVPGRAAADPFPAEIDLAAPPPDVVTIHGAAAFDHLGATVYGFDVDGQGAAEVVASAALNRLSAGQSGFPGQGGADGPPGTVRPNAGAVHVIFGGPALAAAGAIDLGTPSTAFATLHGALAGGTFGEETGFGDLGAGPALVVGAFTAAGTGEAYVVPAAAILPGAVLDLASPPAGSTVVRGASAGDLFSDGLRMADLDGDGLDDLVASSPRARAAGRTGAGVVYAIFGRVGGLPPEVDLAAAPSGLDVVLLLGPAPGDNLGYTLTVADVDIDGRADIVTNVMRGDGAADAAPQAGDVSVVAGAAIDALR